MQVAMVVVLAVVLLLYVGLVVYQTERPLPVGVDVAGDQYRVSGTSVTFLADRTYVDAQGERHSEQQIFDEVFRLIDRSQEYLLVDFFLYNDWQGERPETTRALASELTQALVAKKQALPQIQITVISDPINNFYGGDPSKQFTRLRQAGINVVVTDLTKLRDSNPLYSVLWRSVIQWFNNSNRGGWVPHPFQAEGPAVTVRSWLSLLNFKANHRKILVADEPQPDGTTRLATLVTSANPHDGSSAHSNVAIKVTSKLWRDAVPSEQAAGAFSGQTVPDFGGVVTDQDGDVTVQLLTEGAIRRRLVELISQTRPGDTIDMAMFYLAERSIIESLLEAANRGVAIRLVLDPNKDAFGHIKNGVPNRPVAHELLSKTKGDVKIRWCDTHGEQCHTKLVLVRRGGEQTMVLGSANLTRRNIADYNLETNVLVSAEGVIPALTHAADFFEEIWSNKKGRNYTVDYDVYADSVWWKTILYRGQEATGLSSF